MATDYTQALINDVVEFYHDPGLIARAALRTLTKISDGSKVLVDPTNPLAYVIDMASCLAAATMIRNEVNTRKMYPYAAQTQEDLYLHMSDKDYAGRFALPSGTPMTIMFNEQELINKLVTDVATGTKKLVIPRNTQFDAGSFPFSIQYPIEITQSLHGKLQVRWDSSVPSPLLTLSSNIIEPEIRVPASQNDLPQNRYVAIKFDTLQFIIVSEQLPIQAQGTASNLTITDLFYYARAFIQLSNGSWLEVKTTHSDQIYNPSEVTVVFRVVGNVVYYHLPQIYINSSLLASKIRVDVYQTKGYLELDLGNYDQSNFTAKWQAIDPADKTIFTAPLDSLNSIDEIIVYSDAVVTGGRGELTFDELRARVLKNAIGAPTIPITNAQISYALIDRGYQIVNNLDLVTDREFLATHPLPAPDDITDTAPLMTSASAGMPTMAITFAQAVTFPGVIDNGKTITITPQAWLTLRNNVLEFVTQMELDALDALPVAERVIAMSSGSYVKVPYYYVLDLTGNVFTVRAYDLDTPQIPSKAAIDENDTTGFQAGIGTATIVRNETGYHLDIITRSSENYKTIDDGNVFVQIGFKPVGEQALAYILGEHIATDADSERIFRFNLASNFAMTLIDQIPIRAQLYTSENRMCLANLNDFLEVLFITTETKASGWVSSDDDALIGSQQIPSGAYVINHEQIRIKFGDSLKTLWTRARSVPLEYEYERYAHDVPKVYEQNIYGTYPDGNQLNIVDGGINYNLLHAAGEPELDNDGNPVYLHRAGDIVEGSGASPYEVETSAGLVMARGVERLLDILVVDGLYWLATDQTAINYQQKIVKFMTSWMVNDLTDVAPTLLEKTSIYFHPQATLGLLEVVVNEGVTTMLSAEQSFFVKLSVPPSTQANDDLKTKLTRVTVKVISNWLKQARLSESTLVKQLVEAYGVAVIDVEVTLTGSLAPYHVVTIVDETRRMTLKKRLVNQSNDTLSIEEDVTVEIVVHKPKEMDV